MALLSAPIGLSWAGILGFSLLRWSIVAGSIGAGLAVILELYNFLRVNAELSDPTNKELRAFALMSYAMSGPSLFVSKMAFFLSWVSLLIWGIVALVRIFL
ncbi:MAG: hypothetical protein OXI91_06215 [Chloroflexota bacterium]|nr:hypothetical protein [Chloroflexota bacterium]